MRAVLAALALAALAGAPASAAPATLQASDGGGGAHVVVAADPGALVAGVELLVDAGLDRETESQNGLAALVAECVLQTPMAGGTRLTDAVDARGASLRYAVGSQGVRFYLEGTPAALDASAPLVAGALASPAFDARTLAAARDALGERIRDDESDARVVGRAMLRAAFYRGAAGFPPYGTTGSLTAFAPADAQAFHTAWYRRGGAVAVAAGRTGVATDRTVAALLAALPTGSAAAVTLDTKPFGAEPRRIVTQRDVGAPYIVLGFAAPSLRSPDFAAALVVRALLRGVLERPKASTTSPLLRPSGTFYGYDADPAQLVIWINGARLDPEVGIGAIDTVVKAAAAKPVTPQVLERYKTAARGEWILEAVSVDERAAAIANAVAQGAGPNAAGDVAAAIDRVTSADIERVAKTYFQKFDVALILPRGNDS